MLNAYDFASPCFKALDLYMCICVNPNLNYTPIQINLRKKEIKHFTVGKKKSSGFEIPAFSQPCRATFDITIANSMLR